MKFMCNVCGKIIDRDVTNATSSGRVYCDECFKYWKRLRGIEDTEESENHD